MRNSMLKLAALRRFDVTDRPMIYKKSMLFKRLRFRLLALPIMLVAVVAQAQPLPVEQSLLHAAQVWSLAKYRHPLITNCQANWDQILLDTLPLIQANMSAENLSARLTSMLQRAGTIPANGAEAGPGWIAATALTPELQQQLHNLAAVRPQAQCYIELNGTPAPDFLTDDGFIDTATFPARSQRLLAMFRLWGAIEYFFPYKDIIGTDWGLVLQESVAAVLSANTSAEFHQAMARFHHRINDGHSYYNSLAYPLQINPHLPLLAKSIDGKTIVSKTLSIAAPLKAGDQILAIGGRPMAELKAERRLDQHGSNPVSRDYWLHRLLLTTASPVPVSIEYETPAGQRGSVQVSAAFSHDQRLLEAPGTAWRSVTVDGSCDIGVVDMARLQPADIVAMFNSLANTDALVFDLRNYPNGTFFGIADRLFNTPTNVAQFDRGNLSNPGQFERSTVALGGRFPSGYQGRVMILVNEITLSQAEYTAMILQAFGNTITIGSQTQGADGNITSILLPQSSNAMFSGLGVFYPDGRPTQRIGIVPDIQVVPTRDDLSAGRDLVLETALDCGLIAQPTPFRAVRAGMYFEPQRPGGGIDAHLAGDRLVALRYGFDAIGEPEWTLGIGQRQRGMTNIELKRHSLSADSQTQNEPAANIELDFHRGPFDPACAIVDQQRITNSVRIKRSIEGLPPVACLRPLVVAVGADNGVNLSGGWYAGEQDGGWALSLQQSANNLTIIAYLYDGAGRPRWLAGVAEYTGQSAVTIEMLQINGYCDGCEPITPQRQSAGSINLQLDSDAPPGANIIASMDVQFRGQQPRRWQRDVVPMQRLTSSPE